MSSSNFYAKYVPISIIYINVCVCLCKFDIYIYDLIDKRDKYIRFITGIIDCNKIQLLYQGG